jgi:hypothetical protein
MCKLKTRLSSRNLYQLNLKFKENNSQQFTSLCNVNHRKYITSQSNDFAACEIGKSHIAFSHGQNLFYTGGNVRIFYPTWLQRHLIVTRVLHLTFCPLVHLDK